MTQMFIPLRIIELKLKHFDKSHKEVFKGVKRLGIIVNVYYIPVYPALLPKARALWDGDFPKSEITLPFYYGLSEEDQNYIIKSVKEGLKMRVGIIVQARMTSTRLPGKVLMPVLGRPLLEYQIERLRRVPKANEIIVATTINETDQLIVDLCRRLGVKIFRGSEADVLSRYYEAARENGIDIVVRVTSDCPIIDPQVIDEVIEFYIRHADQYDYVSNTMRRTYPRGMDTEIFSSKVLTEAYQEADKQTEREHVTPFFHTNPKRYRLGNISYKENQSHHRWTVDTPEDFILLTKIIEYYYRKNQDFTLEDTLKLLKEKPEWVCINAHIEQKRLNE